jgi:SAM-dependent methyltransferase
MEQKNNLVSKDFIFTQKNGKLEFVGDFEGYYKNIQDPWGQSGDDERLQNLYKESRNYLINSINNLFDVHIGCEIGCGIGYVTKQLNDRLEHMKWDGIDISPTAIEKAKNKFKNIDFFCGNICSTDLKIDKKYDVVVLNQILWYILVDLETVFKNINDLLNKNGYLIISTFFLKEQKYGTEIIGSFDELVIYCLKHLKNNYKLIHADIKYGDESDEHRDSILILKKFI